MLAYNIYISVDCLFKVFDDYFLLTVLYDFSWNQWSPNSPPLIQSMLVIFLTHDSLLKFYNFECYIPVTIFDKVNIN